MNNAYINKEYEEVSTTNLVNYREQATRLTEVIEALNNIQGSSFWLVLKQNVFDVEYAKAKRRLEIADDTTEIYRLQGELRLAKRYNLEKLIKAKRDELLAIRKKLNE